MGQILALLVLTALAALFLLWRFRACMKRRRPLNQESTWVVYAIPLAVYDMLRTTFPGLSQGVQIGCLAALLVLSWLAGRWVTRLYDRKLKERLESEETL